MHVSTQAIKYGLFYLLRFILGLFQFVHFHFFPNYINIYFKKDKVKGYKGPQTLTCIDKKKYL